MSRGRENKPHIGIFGRRNNGKSSLINTLTEQDIAIVSEIAGTTTDPVKKSMEIPGVGPAVLIDTAGIDDIGELGAKRVKKSIEAIKIIDLAILIITANHFGEEEETLVEKFRNYSIPFFIIHNKSDIEALDSNFAAKLRDEYKSEVIDFSALNPVNNKEVIDIINRIMPETVYKSVSMLGSLLSKGDAVLLITPIDTEAPEGRMILPQVQAIRDVLDNDCIAIVLKEHQLDDYLAVMNPRPKLAITDSQVFAKANASVPKDIPLTSFSIMLARFKGEFENYIKGTPYISELMDGDKVLILESCTHHVTCDDIGRIKIPDWLNSFTGKKLEFEIVAGLSPLPRNIKEYAMVIQCGGCVLTQKQIAGRLKEAIDAGIPVSNYGMTISYIHGVYERAVAPFLKVKQV